MVTDPFRLRLQGDLMSVVVRHSDTVGKPKEAGCVPPQEQTDDHDLYMCQGGRRSVEPVGQLQEHYAASCNLTSSGHLWSRYDFRSQATVWKGWGRNAPAGSAARYSALLRVSEHSEVWDLGGTSSPQHLMYAGIRVRCVNVKPDHAGTVRVMRHWMNFFPVVRRLYQCAGGLALFNKDMHRCRSVQGPVEDGTSINELAFESGGLVADFSEIPIKTNSVALYCLGNSINASDLWKRYVGIIPISLPLVEHSSYQDHPYLLSELQKDGSWDQTMLPYERLAGIHLWNFPQSSEHKAGHVYYTERRFWHSGVDQTAWIIKAFSRSLYELLPRRTMMSIRLALVNGLFGPVKRAYSALCYDQSRHKHDVSGHLFDSVMSAMHYVGPRNFDHLTMHAISGWVKPDGRRTTAYHYIYEYAEALLLAQYLGSPHAFTCQLELWEMRDEPGWYDHILRQEMKDEGIKPTPVCIQREYHARVMGRAMEST